MSYAEGTRVPVSKTKMELDNLLLKHGSTKRVIGGDESAGTAFVIFALGQRQYRLDIPLPKPDEFRAAKGRGLIRGGKERTPEQQKKVFEQACRERWRAVLLLTKAKLEMVGLGLSTPEREFLADLLLPDGAKLHHALTGAIRSTYEKGTPLLGSGS